MAEKEHILVVDDDKAFRVATRTFLEDEHYKVSCVGNGESALAGLDNESYDLVLSDMVMGKMSGIELLKELKRHRPELPVIMVTGFASVETAVEAMRVGAVDYLTKPANNDELLIKIRKALDLRKKERELRMLREEMQTTYSFGNMISQSEAMKEVIRQIRRVADTDVTVLLQGESGTGKELAARALHFNSTRKDRPFVAVSCSAIPETLLESELFGYEKGAFTGAVRQRIGKFEEAHTGTLFLDEIGDIAPSVQTKLLRVLQEKSIERIGGSGLVNIETRIVVATNRDLELMVSHGDFRGDLYYRLNVFPIKLPPLRERMEDIPLLAEHFLERYSSLSGSRMKAIAPGVINEMMSYSWRGNIRELENLIKRAIIKSTGDTITAIELPGAEADNPNAREEPTGLDPQTPYKEYLSAITRHAEERYLRRMLKQYRGNINQIARLMDVDRKTIYRKMADYAIDPSAFRD
jgi:DNA-binding NtrC family response regulator